MVSSSGAQTPAQPGSAEDCGGLWRPLALPQVGEALESAPWTSSSALLTFPSFGPLSNPICPRQVNQSPQGPVTSSNYPLGHVLPNTWPTYRSHPAKPELIYSHTPSNRTDSPFQGHGSEDTFSAGREITEIMLLSLSGPSQLLERVASKLRYMQTSLQRNPHFKKTSLRFEFSRTHTLLCSITIVIITDTLVSNDMLAFF